MDDVKLEELRQSKKVAKMLLQVAAMRLSSCVEHKCPGINSGECCSLASLERGSIAFVHSMLATIAVKREAQEKAGEELHEDKASAAAVKAVANELFVVLHKLADEHQTKHLIHHAEQAFGDDMPRA